MGLFLLVNTSNPHSYPKITVVPIQICMEYNQALNWQMITFDKTSTEIGSQFILELQTRSDTKREMNKLLTFSHPAY